MGRCHVDKSLRMKAIDRVQGKCTKSCDCSAYGLDDGACIIAGRPPLDSGPTERKDICEVKRQLKDILSRKSAIPSGNEQWLRGKKYEIPAITGDVHIASHLEESTGSKENLWKSTTSNRKRLFPNLPIGRDLNQNHPVRLETSGDAEVVFYDHPRY